MARRIPFWGLAAHAAQFEAAGVKVLDEEVVVQPVVDAVLRCIVAFTKAHQVSFEAHLEVFKTIVPLKGIGARGFTGDGIGDISDSPNVPNVTNDDKNPEYSTKLLELISDTPNVTIPLLAAELGIVERSVKWYIKTLKEDGSLVRVGGTRGHWEVIDDSDISGAHQRGE